MRPAEQVFPPLPGEDGLTASLSEVASWIAIYEELASVLGTIIGRHEADGDQVAELRQNLARIDSRLAAWRDRHAELAGLAIDRTRHSLTYRGRELRLTRREADLLEFMIRHPGRSFTTAQLATMAWHNSRLSGAQVRTYMMRLRQRLHAVGLDGVITLIRNRGYGAEPPPMENPA